MSAAGPSRFFLIPLSQQRWVLYPSLRPQTQDKQTLSARALALATRQYDKLGQAKARSLKRRLWDLGQTIVGRRDGFETCMARIESPKWWSYRKFITPGSQAWDKIEASASVQLVVNNGSHAAALHNYSTPDFLLDLHSTIRKQATTYHRRKWLYVLATPLTIPFMLIPLVPNIPFFYLVWRAWCLHGASKGASYLNALLQRQKVIFEPSSVLSACLKRPSADALELLVGPKEVDLLLSKLDFVDAPVGQLGMFKANNLEEGKESGPEHSSVVHQKLLAEIRLDLERMIAREQQDMDKLRATRQVMAITQAKHEQFIKQHQHQHQQ